MRSLRAVALAVVGGTVGTVAIAALVAGCGDDNGGSPTEAGTEDQTAEAAADVVGTDTTGHDALADASDAAADARDATVDADAGRVDADAGGDVLDAAREADAADAHPDADASSDASDASDAPNALQTYAARNGQAYCAGFLRCCPGFDAGGFNVAGCGQANQTVGWDTTLPLNAAAYTNGHLLLNADAGAGCLAALQNFDCTTGTVTPAGMATLLRACNGVLTGTIPTGTGGCVSSFECANGYCALPGDGGTGTCTALAGVGGPCSGSFVSETKDQMCSQAGTVPGLFCDVNDADGGTPTCAAPLADNQPCFDGTTFYYDDYGCSSLLCGDLGCGTSTVAYPDPRFCGAWAPTDAGGD